MRWHGRRPGVVTAVMMRHVLRRVKPAVRIRKEKELQSCHGVDQHARAGNPDLGLAVARVVLAGVVRPLLLFEGGSNYARRYGSRPLDLQLGLGLGAGRIAASAATIFRVDNNFSTRDC